MARSVVLKGVARCHRCQHPHRWCICDAHREYVSAISVDVLMHYQEAMRPSSTGHLIKRVLPESGQHSFKKDVPITRETVQRAGKELWILHPSGEPLPTDVSVSKLQVLLLDGNWDQAGEMTKHVEGWGRRVSLPMSGKSRYWLRAQQGDGKFSTMEALLFILAALGLQEEHERLRLQFELHVYAGLCARGRKALALEYLENSPVREAYPEIVQRFAPRWQREAGS